MTSVLTPFEKSLAEARRRRETALKLRRQELSYAQIGLKLGVSRQRALQMVQRAEADANTKGVSEL